MSDVLTPTRKTRASKTSGDLSIADAVKSPARMRRKTKAEVQTATGDQRPNDLGTLSDPTIVAVEANLPLSDRAEAQSGREAQSCSGFGILSDPTATTMGADFRLSGQAEAVVHSDPVLGVIIALWRQRQDLRRAEQRLNLQCQSICRRECAGDKDEAAKLWKALLKGETDNAALVLVLTPYRQAMTSLDIAAKGIEKELVRAARKHPLWLSWAKDVRGLGELSFAGFLGEAGRSIRDYRSVSALWKRFGLAVIGDERQRRVADAELALAHGYNPQRRSYAYVLSTNLIKTQKADDAYRVLYDRRKEHELAREGVTKAHAHNRAMRVMVKELLKDAWIAAGKISSVQCVVDAH